MEKEYMKKITQIVERELDQLSNKPSLSPSEVCAAKEAVGLLKDMKEYAEMDEGGYSERGARRNSYGNNYGYAYGYAPEMYGNTYAYRYPMSMNYENSYGDRRSSRASGGDYSGHSIKDRMVDRLERMVDEAKSEYERQEIINEIAKIKQSN